MLTNENIQLPFEGISALPTLFTTPSTMQMLLHAMKFLNNGYFLNQKIKLGTYIILILLRMFPKTLKNRKKAHHKVFKILKNINITKYEEDFSIFVKNDANEIRNHCKIQKNYQIVSRHIGKLTTIQKQQPTGQDRIISSYNMSENRNYTVQPTIQYIIPLVIYYYYLSACIYQS